MLAEGYDPVLTEHKLTEWPTPEEWERRSTSSKRPRKIQLAIETLADAGNTMEPVDE